MTAYEFMLSESQERMLMVLRPEREDAARAIFEKWELDFAVIGRLTDTGRIVVRHHGAVEADVPLAPLNDAAPLYHRPTAETAEAAADQSREGRGSCWPDRSAVEAGRLSRPRLASLGVGPVRQHRRRPDGEATRRGGCRGGQAGGT